MRVIAFFIVLAFGTLALAEAPARREIEYSGPVRLNLYARANTATGDPGARASTWRYYYSAPSYYYGCGYYSSCYRPFGYGRFIFAGFAPWGGCW